MIGLKSLAILCGIVSLVVRYKARFDSTRRFFSFSLLQMFVYCFWISCAKRGKDNKNEVGQ